VNPANASAPARTASGSSDATSGGCGPSAAPTTRPERCERVEETSRPGEPQPTLRALGESGAARRVLPRRRVARAGPSSFPFASHPTFVGAGPIRERALSVPTRHETILRPIAPDPPRRRALKPAGGSSWRGIQGPARTAPHFLAGQGATDGPTFLRCRDSSTPNEQGWRPYAGVDRAPRSDAYIPHTAKFSRAGAKTSSTNAAAPPRDVVAQG
jgi:hypothetical protein